MVFTLMLLTVSSDTFTLKLVDLPAYVTVIFCVPTVFRLVGEHVKPLVIVSVFPLE